MKITRSDAGPILDTLERKGIPASIIGGVASRGYSEHDLDLLVPVKSRFLYNKYVKIMRDLGFVRTAGAFDHMEHDLEEWQKEGLVIDVWLTEE